MANKTANWDASYEASPADANNVANGATRIRAMKVDVRERIAEDHYMAIAGNQSDHGQHKQVTFQAPLGADPNPGANKAATYTKTANACDLYHQDGANNVIQITKSGAVHAFPTGTVLAFGQDTAPTGWTRLTTGDTIYDAATDNAMFCFAKTGNIAQGGDEDPQSHDHEQANHQHQLDKDAAANYFTSGITVTANGGYLFAPYAGSSGSAQKVKTQTANDGGGGNTAVSTPYYIEMILAKKD